MKFRTMAKGLIRQTGLGLVRRGPLRLNYRADIVKKTALKHHTSKLASFADLAQVSTLGFRGEALSSLCGTANLSLITSTASTAPAGTSLTFSRNGECIVGGKVARSKGTTIKVEKLFESLPVRRKELIKNAKREFGKALELLQAYALISTGVRFEVKNTTKK